LRGEKIFTSERRRKIRKRKKKNTKREELQAEDGVTHGKGISTNEEKGKPAVLRSKSSQSKSSPGSRAKQPCQSNLSWLATGSELPVPRNVLSKNKKNKTKQNCSQNDCLKSKPSQKDRPLFLHRATVPRKTPHFKASKRSQS